MSFPFVCPCGFAMIWQSDNDLENIGHDEDGIVQSYSCASDICPNTIELFMPQPEVKQ